MTFLKKMCAVVASLFLFAASAFAGDISLKWDSGDQDGVGYKMHYGVSLDNLDQEIDVGNVLVYTVTNLDVGTTYCFRVSAYDASGNASARSYAVCDKAILSPPTGFSAVQN